MRKPLIYSGAIHVAIVVVTIFGLPARQFEPVESKVLPVELLTVAEMTNLKRLAKEKPKAPKPIEQPTPPKPEEPPKPVVKAASEPAAEPEPTPPEEKAEPIPDEKAEAPKPEEKKPEPPKEAKKKPVPVKEAKKKKKLTYEQQMANLLNKLEPTPSEEAEAEVADKDLNVEDQDDVTQPLTVSQLDALRQKINPCYNAGFLEGALDSDKLYAYVSFELAEDGSLIGTPTIGETGPGASKQLAVIARKAVAACAPYDNLPKDNYAAWKSVNARFTVAGMQ
ncbi:MAG: hypothetical protein Q7T44_04980 [Parvibaculum sp.]|nr:hypothetical protein [Parvibaculum sp.]